jgi:thiol:disulfide interchange protein
LKRFRRDWTLLPFVVYGAVPFALWLTFDEYVGDELYMLLAFLVLALGAWFYLRNNGDWKRFGALFGALALAMFIAAAGKAILVPSQDWPFTIDRGLALSEAKHTIIMWGWFALTMLVPLGIKFLPGSNDSTQVSPAEG